MNSEVTFMTQSLQMIKWGSKEKEKQKGNAGQTVYTSYLQCMSPFWVKKKEE